MFDAHTGQVRTQDDLAGVPDVIFFNAALHHLYVAIGEPGLVEVFDTEAWRRVQTVRTEKGAHTLAFDALQDKLYAFLPETHRATVYQDRSA